MTLPPCRVHVEFRRERRRGPARGQEGVLHHHRLLLDIQGREIGVGGEVVGVGGGAVAGPELRQISRTPFCACQTWVSSWTNVAWARSDASPKSAGRVRAGQTISDGPATKARGQTGMANMRTRRLSSAPPNISEARARSPRSGGGGEAASWGELAWHLPASSSAGSRFSRAEASMVTLTRADGNWAGDLDLTRRSIAMALAGGYAVAAFSAEAEPITTDGVAWCRRRSRSTPATARSPATSPDPPRAAATR